MGSVTGMRVLVTGASSGIGEATARALVAEGASVAVLARREERVRALADEIGGVPLVGDVTDEGVRALVDEAAARLGGLDVLVNSAGVMRPGSVSDTEMADWRAMFEVNVLGLLATTKAALPHLRASAPGSTIVNVSSMSGRRVPGVEAAVYAGTKHAVHAISQGLHEELQPDGVRVTVISPGFVDTEIFADATGETGEHYREQVAQGIEAADVAAAIVHAVSAPRAVTTLEVALVPSGH